MCGGPTSRAWAVSPSCPVGTWVHEGIGLSCVGRGVQGTSFPTLVVLDTGSRTHRVPTVDPPRGALPPHPTPSPATHRRSGTPCRTGGRGPTRRRHGTSTRLRTTSSVPPVTVRSGQGGCWEYRRVGRLVPPRLKPGGLEWGGRSGTTLHTGRRVSSLVG